MKHSRITNTVAASSGEDSGPKGCENRFSEESIHETYRELKKIAAFYLHAERSGHLLQTTALVNEAYLKLRQQVEWVDQDHFFRGAAKIMRQILVDHARTKNAKKRDVELGTNQVSRLGFQRLGKGELDVESILALDMALLDLAKVDPRQALLVELRFFAGLTEAEACKVLGIGERTARRDWQMSRAWLFGRLQPMGAGSERGTENERGSSIGQRG